MRIPDIIKKCLGFVGLRQPNGSIHWGGTAFVVSVPGLRYPDYKFDFLVTAKHVADEIVGADAVVRMNRADGSFIIFELINAPWWFHPTEAATVDAAVTIFSPAPDLRLDVRNIPLKMFATEQLIQNRDIGIGDEVYIAGLFTKVTETSKNQPVVRLGNLAMLPDEKINFPAIGMIDAYVVEARSIGGLSGCPVFVRETINMHMSDVPGGPVTRALHGAGAFYLLGSMIGHWQIPKGSSPVLAEAVNMGMSVVVPAKKIIEILDHPELIAMREYFEEQRRKEDEKSTSLDSALSKAEAEQALTKEDYEAVLKKVSRKSPLN